MTDSVIESNHPDLPEGEGQLLLHWPGGAADEHGAITGVEASGRIAKACWEIWGHLRFTVPAPPQQPRRPSDDEVVAADAVVLESANRLAEFMAALDAGEIDVASAEAVEHFAVVKLVLHGAEAQEERPELDPLHPLAVVAKMHLVRMAIDAARSSRS